MLTWNLIRMARLAALALPLAALCALAPAKAADEAEKPEPVKPDGSGRKLTRQLRPELLIGESSFFYASTPDVKKARAAFERTAFVGLVNEEEVNAPILAAFGKLRETYVKGDGTRGEAEVKRRNEEVDLLMKLLPMLESQVSISIDLDAAGLANLSSGKLPKFMLVAAMPPGDLGGERQGQIEDILESYRGRLTIDAKYRDFDSARNSYAIHGLENADMGTYEAWAFIENLFVYCQGKGQIEAAIDRYATKKGVGSLALNANFQNSYKQVGRDDKGESLAYVQINPKIINFEKIESMWARLMITSFAGVSADGTLPDIALGIQAGDGNRAPVRERLYVKAMQRENVAQPSDGCKGNSARFVAGDGLYYWATQGKLSDSYVQLKDYVSLLYGTASQGIMDQKIQMAVGAKDPADFSKKLDLFKGEFSFFLEYVPKNGKFVSWPDILQNFQIVVCLEIDRENVNYESQLKEMMTKLEAGTGVPYLTTNTNGTIVRYQRGAAPGEGPTASLGLRANMETFTKNTPFFACWARTDLDCEPGPVQRHFLLLCDDLPTLRKAMAQRNSQRTSLFEEPKFKDTLKSFRESRYQISYLDMVKATTAYSSLIPLVARAELIERDKLNKFPSAGSLRPHLFSMVGASSLVSKGEYVLSEYSSPTGILPMAALVSSVAWPELNYQRQRAISEEVDSKFKQIMLGLQLYAADFDRYPPALSDLVGPYVDLKRLNVFESPFNRGAVQTALDVDNPDLSNLVYVPNRNMQDLGNDIMVYEKQPTRIERGESSKLLYHVMTVDGRVRGIPKAALDRALLGKFSSTSLGKGGSSGTGTGSGGSTAKPKK